MKALDFAATENLIDANDGFIHDLWCRSIDMCPKNIKQSPLQIAMTSEMLIKLHVNDTGGMSKFERCVWIFFSHQFTYNHPQLQTHS